MPKKSKNLCVDDLRHAEYYGMQPVFDELYRRSLDGDNFTDLMDIILSRDNILLAYRNIKANGGSYTAGTDNKNISDIGCLPPETVVEKVRFIVTGSHHGYRPKPVRRKDIPKPNGKTRPLGIPCIWDRLVQQCIKQVMEPICEAKFSDNSYGFRPNRSVEHAMQRTYTMLQRMNLHYVIEFDIKGFFDNVNHSMSIEELCALPVKEIADKDCILFLWATFPQLKEALQLIKAWGFTYKSVAFVWLKQNRKSPTWFYGLGFWTRGNAEICLLATKGHPKRQSNKVHQFIISPVEQHSKKPDITREKILALMGDLPRIELFARQHTPGWDVWGNEIKSDIRFAGKEV